ncbi:hypothetical protein MTBK_16230 [Mycobacterium tuberculosis K]|nr:hypothetical protein MTBK_16230 [Mycobacterium tuberculosis K]BAQ05542.1 hypothetical protein KURONO_1743 [Mycobacterium tuberculosis str. Kurono]
MMDTGHEANLLAHELMNGVHYRPVRRPRICLRRDLCDVGGNQLVTADNPSVIAT